MRDKRGRRRKSSLWGRVFFISWGWSSVWVNLHRNHLSTTQRPAPSSSVLSSLPLFLSISFHSLYPPGMFENFKFSTHCFQCYSVVCWDLGRRDSKGASKILQKISLSNIYMYKWHAQLWISAEGKKASLQKNNYSLEVSLRKPSSWLLRDTSLWLCLLC